MMRCLKCRGTNMKVTMNFSLSAIVQCQDCKETYHKIKWPKQTERRPK